MDMEYTGIDSPLVDKQIMDALSDSHFNYIHVSYRNEALEHNKELRVKISSDDIREPRRYRVHIEIINRPNPREIYNAGPLVRRTHNYPRFYASALEVKLHLARAKKQFKMATGIQNLYAYQFRVSYFSSNPRDGPRNESKSHSKQAIINAVIKHHHNIKKANAFRRLSLIKKVQQRFLNKYYDPSHPIGQRRLLREFETLQRNFEKK